MKTQLQKELDAIMETMRATKKANTVEYNGPELKGTFTYRKTTAIKAHDLAL